ncbi:MAG: carboxylesterase family protein [Actinomycetales bacterium]|nr:carboxylesterase family protein [Actinomycetales bacterium]
MSTRVTTRVSAGELAGTREGGIDRYLAVPYAAPPVGARRFALPEPPPAWAGARDATEYGPTAPQTPYGPATARLLNNVIREGDDFLTANVWAPADAEGAPVMVWVHGGSFAHGSNALDGYDGSTFARDGVVFVGINYRLGSEGFSVLDDAPTNLGLHDVAAVLRWVRREIAAFGGDPARVTAFGESAGAIALATLLARPGHFELFDRVILQSGMATAAPRKKGGRITRRIAKQLGIPTTRAAFAATPAARLLEAETVVTAGATPISGGASFGPVVGDELVPVDPAEAIAGGAGDEVPVLLGWNTDEWRLWFVPSGIVDRIGLGLFTAARVAFRITPRVLRAYRAAHPGASRGELFGHLATDILLRRPLQRQADSRLAHGGAPTWVYEFAWPSPVARLGAAHAVEIGFVFDGLRSDDSVRIAGDDAPQPLADRMHAAWVRFAAEGDPGWRPWDARRPILVIDGDPEHDASTVVEGHRDAELRAWPERRRR